MNAPGNSSGDMDWGGNQDNHDRLTTLNDGATDDVAGDSSGFLSVQLDELDAELGEVGFGRTRPR